MQQLIALSITHAALCNNTHAMYISHIHNGYAHACFQEKRTSGQEKGPASQNNQFNIERAVTSNTEVLHVHLEFKQLSLLNILEHI